METFFRCRFFGHPASLAPVTRMDPPPIQHIVQRNLDRRHALRQLQDNRDLWLRFCSLNSSIINKGRKGDRSTLYQALHVNHGAPAKIAFKFNGGERQGHLRQRARLGIRDGNAV